MHLSVDRTQVKANASLESMQPRTVQEMPEEFVERLFRENRLGEPGEEGKAEPIRLTEQAGYPEQLGEVDGASSAGGEADREGEAREGLSNASHFSRTDPDARLVSRPGKGVMLGYAAEFWVDSREGVIAHADGVRGNVAEDVTVMKALLRQRKESGLGVGVMSADKGMGGCTGR